MGKKPSRTVDSSTTLFSVDKLRQYFACISNLRPVMNEDAQRVLATYYQRLRKFSQLKDCSNDVPRIAAQRTVRFLESLIRLSQAHARLMFQSEVNILDALTVIDLMENAQAALKDTSDQLDLRRTKFVSNPEEGMLSVGSTLLNCLGLSELLPKLQSALMHASPSCLPRIEPQNEAESNLHSDPPGSQLNGSSAVLKTMKDPTQADEQGTVNRHVSSDLIGPLEDVVFTQRQAEICKNGSPAEIMIDGEDLTDVCTEIPGYEESAACDGSPVTHGNNSSQGRSVDGHIMTAQEIQDANNDAMDEGPSTSGYRPGPLATESNRNNFRQPLSPSCVARGSELAADNPNFIAITSNFAVAEATDDAPFSSVGRGNGCRCGVAYNGAAVLKEDEPDGNISPDLFDARSIPSPVPKKRKEYPYIGNRPELIDSAQGNQAESVARTSLSKFRFEEQDAINSDDFDLGFDV